jgi:putative transposase
VKPGPSENKLLGQVLPVIPVNASARSGYYACKAKPKSDRTVAQEALLVSIKQSFENSQGIYGRARVHRDLHEEGIRCGEKRVARLMSQAQLRSVRGYKRPRYKVGMPATTAPNRLQREFTVAQPDQVWVSDITCIRTYEGWLYLAVVIDLYSRLVVGWSMSASVATELVLDALMMAVWRRRPKTPVMIHSDQGSQFGRDDFNRWCKDNRLVPSMSRRGNCWGNGGCRAVLQQPEEGAGQAAHLCHPRRCAVRRV